MGAKDTDTAVAYQNKDIVSKLFGSQMKGKSLSLFGLGTDLKVVDARPTNIPIVQARELRMDNLFELEDGSVGILDYESEYRKENFTKYGRYIMEVIDRYLKEGKKPDIHMMVLYTADIESSKTALTWTACSIQVEASYLAGVPLPLTYKGEEKKQEAIRECVDLARRIPDKDQESFTLAGILSFTDKVISEETRQYIKEVIGMTQVEKMLMDEGRREGRQEGRQEAVRKMARNMLKRGDSPEAIAEVLEVPVETIKAWEQEVCAVV